jgi:hypothetical protein
MLINQFSKPLLFQADPNHCGNYLGVVSLNTHKCQGDPNHHYSFMFHLGQIKEGSIRLEQIKDLICQYPNLFHVIRVQGEFKGYLIKDNAISDYEHRRWLQSCAAKLELQLLEFDREGLRLFYDEILDDSVEN